jgi:hypothetical protein
MHRTLDVLPVFATVNGFGFELCFASFAAFDGGFDQLREATGQSPAQYFREPQLAFAAQ